MDEETTNPEITIIMRANGGELEFFIKVGAIVDENRSAFMLCLAHGMTELALTRVHEVSALGHKILTAKGLLVDTPAPEIEVK